MSYILDALRRADAERDRGAVPSLNSQSSTGAAAHRRPSSSSAHSTLPWVIAGSLAMGLGGLYWAYRGAAQDKDAPVVAKAPTASAATPAPVVAVAQVPAPITPPITPPPVQATPLAAAPVTPAAATPPARRAPAPTAVNDRVLTRNELPADVQRALPTLAMSGSVYSPQPKNRMVIVDGRLSFEGEQVVPGLVIERIDPKAVVLRYQGLRFNVPL
jgi:general secretion pathway protein B